MFADLDCMRRRWTCRLLTKLDFESMKFSLLFLGMTPPESVPEDPKDRVPPLGITHFLLLIFLGC